MNNMYSLTLLTLLIVVLFTGYNVVGNHITGNSNIDAKSIEIITITNNNLEKHFNETMFEQSELGISENTSFDNVEAFSREFLEEQSEAQTNVGIYENFIHIPTMIKQVSGIPDEYWQPIWWVFTSVVGVILIVVGYRLFFGGGKITKS